MPYDPADLTPPAPASLAWGIAWVRMILRDPKGLQDAEVEAVLTSTAWAHDGTTYYQPHEAAATLVQTDPTRATQMSVDNASKTLRDPGSIATSIRSTYRSQMLDIIEAEAGARPPSGRTLTPTW